MENVKFGDNRIFQNTVEYLTVKLGDEIIINCIDD